MNTVFDCTKPTWNSNVARASATLVPGMKMGFWADQAHWMCPDTTKERVGPNPWLPKEHPHKSFNPQFSDIDRIIEEKWTRDGSGEMPPTVFLDFEFITHPDFDLTPGVVPPILLRIVDLIRHYKKNSGKMVMFYPGFVGVGATSDDELLAIVTGKPWHGTAVTQERRNQIINNASLASVVINECDAITPVLYAGSNRDIETGAIRNWPLMLDFYKLYWPAREIIPWCASHQDGVNGQPPISPECLTEYARVLALCSTHDRYVLWGNADQGAKSLARLLMGEAHDPVLAGR